MSFTSAFLSESIEILRTLSSDEVDAMVAQLALTRQRGGRLFFCGSGGGAGHASHATCDFRKLGGFEAYCVSDNISELTARVNDDGWEHAYSDWLTGSRINAKDCLVVFSVGGGDEERGVSANLVNAIYKAREVGAAVTGVVGRDGGALRRLADACVLVPTVIPSNVTAQTESMQALLWHLMVMHPDVLKATPKWESMEDDLTASGTPQSGGTAAVSP
jgi:D-sedoheptulose 7-phosphate isomerase